MRDVLRAFFACALLVVAAPSHGKAAGTTALGAAPAFDLQLLNGGGSMASAELFSSFEHTFLLFWDSGCPHCVEMLAGCEAFYRKHFGEETTVVGILGDAGDVLHARGVLEAEDISFFQLIDPGGGTARAYDVPLSTAALVLVDRDGVMCDRSVDPAGDIGAVMEGMLARRDAAAPEGESAEQTGVTPASAPKASSDWVFSGRQRIRFLGIDSRGGAPAGLYGEDVSPGNNVHYRFEFEASRMINRHVRAGGLLRISNEGDDVLRAGPQYLGSEWGSAFAELSANDANLRLGYYTIAMTPLTLMRWDWDDNPRIGGDAGCGCGATGGVLLVESLEELAPELVLEGGLASYDRSRLRTRLFYAIPRRAKELSYVSGPQGEANRAQYSLETFGFETLYQRHDKRTSSFWKAGLHIAGTRENKRSVDFIALRYPVPDPWRRSVIVTASARIPLVRFVGVAGEWIVWNRMDVDSLNKVYHDMYAFEWRSSHAHYDGEGGIAGIAFEHSQNLYAKCDYLRLDGGFYSLFAALSYAPDREGVRFSGKAPIPLAHSAVSFFYKRLRELKAAAGVEREYESIAGVSVDMDLPNGAGGSIGWMDRGAWRKGAIDSFDDSRWALGLAGRYRFTKTALLELHYQRVATTVWHGGDERESLANLYSLSMSSSF
ncbi:MAG: TlpA family protein disulfide reductase [Chitinivibrionia bacterium]|nr:TlpA family protein disulfide reductase [Chitinivibrionia bacterium]